MHLYDMAVGTAKGLVEVEDSLDVVFAGRNVPDAVEWEPERPFVHDRRLARLQSFDVHTEERLGGPPVDSGVPRLIHKIAGEEKEDTTV